VEQRIGAWLAAWASAVVARPRLVAMATLALAGLAMWYAARNLGVNTDTANMIAPTIAWRQHYNEYRDAFPLRDRNLLIVVDAPTAARADEFSTALLRELRARPERYRSPLLAGEGEFFERNGLLYLPTAELGALTDRLAEAQPLLGLLERRLDGPAVLDVAHTTLSAGTGEAVALGSFYQQLAATIEGVAAGRTDALAWDALLASELPTDSGAATRRVIALQPAVDFRRMQPAAAAIAEVREIAARLDASGDVRVRLTGTVAMEHEELLSVSRGAGFGALATFAMVALVLYAALRSWRLLVTSLVTLVAGLSLTAAFAAAAVGQLNLLSIAFVVLNVGLGSDYVIHVLLRYRELVAAGAPAPQALVETVRGVGSSLVLCAVTTAAGFYSFIPTTFSGVSELGLIAGTGVFFGLFVSVTLLPALVAWWDTPRSGAAAPTWLDPRLFAPLSRAPRLVLALTTVALVAALAVLPRVTFDSNPIHLRDPDSESVRTLLDLVATGDAPLMNLVAVAPNATVAGRWADELRRLAEVRRVTTADALVPAEQDEKLALLDDLELLMGTDFARLERTEGDPAALAASLARLEAASAEQPAAGALHDAIAQLRARLAAGDGALRDATLRRLDEALTASLPRELARLAASFEAEKFERGDLPDALAARWLAADGRELVDIVPAENVSDNDAARRFISAVHAVVPTATGLPVVYQEASATVVAAFERALVYAFVMVAAILFLVMCLVN
jgi:hopanoid biosynthesis associated RND transporter like protein HpnN